MKMGPLLREYKMTPEEDQLTEEFEFVEDRLVIRRGELEDTTLEDLWDCGPALVNAGSSYETSSGFQEWWQLHCTSKSHREALRHVETNMVVTGFRNSDGVGFKAHAGVRAPPLPAFECFIPNSVD